MAVAALFVAVTKNLNATGRVGIFSLRLLTGALLVVGYYVLAWISRRGQHEDSVIERVLHNTSGAAVVTALVYLEASQGWPVVWWIVTAIVWALLARRFEVEEITVHADLLALGTIVVTLYTAFTSAATWHGFALYSVTVPLVAAGAYLLSRWSEHDRLAVTQGSGHFFTWSGSLLVAVLIWYELQPVPIAVAPAWLLLGIVLFEIGLARSSLNLRLQGYVALTASFIRMIFANLAAEAGGSVATVLPLVVGLLYVYSRLEASTPPEGLQHGAGTKAAAITGVRQDVNQWRTAVGHYHGYLAVAALALLLRFQVMPDWVATAWAALALVLAAAAWLLARPVFLQQALLLTAAVTYRALFYNLPQETHPRLPCVGSVSLLLLAAMACGFALRRASTAADRGHPLRLIVAHPEQVWFFTPLALLTVLFVIVMPRGSTVAWGVEGVVAFLFALAVKERSFRLAGLSLLLLSVAKIVLLDVWRLHGAFRFLTFTVLGCALLLVSFLYTRYREAFRQLL